MLRGIDCTNIAFLLAFHYLRFTLTKNLEVSFALFINTESNGYYRGKIMTYIDI